jgi:3-methyladenine DNA glycosylase AlkD
MKRERKEEIIRVVAEIQTALSALPVKNAQGLRAVRRRFSDEVRSARPQTVIAIANELVESGRFECRFIAYEMILNHNQTLHSLGPKEVSRLARGLDNWGAVDTFACYVSGPAWRRNQLSDDLIHRWARSKDRWRRRAALVSTVPLNSKAQGGLGDSARTLSVCRLVVSDRDDMVVKALSWALRELSKRDAKATLGFLARHELELSPRVLREVRNKLATGRKSGRDSRLV